MEEIRRLVQEGLSITAISTVLGCDRKTVRKYLQHPGVPRYGPRRPRRSKLEPYLPYLKERLAAGVWNTVVLLRELRQRGYSGGGTILKDYLQPLRQAAREVAVRRFETPPGHQAQVDWGYLGVLEEEGGQERPLWAFVLTLGCSRAMFAQVSCDQKLESFLRLHEAAFEALGGVPEEILYDRVKTVMLGTDDRGEVRWHPLFLDFARYWGFRPRLCQPYRAQTKGKVERGIRYLRTSFLPGLQASSLEEVNGQLRSWVDGVAHRRVHGTTHEVVQEAWEREKTHLQPLAGRQPYPLVPQELRKAGRDAYVTYHSNRYSVPWRYAGQELWVREVGGDLEIHRDQQPIARHPLSAGRYQVLTQREHHQGMPYRSGPQPARGKVRLKAGVPQVEARPLAHYEAWAEGGGR